MPYPTIDREENLCQVQCIARHAVISDREPLVSRHDARYPGFLRQNRFVRKQAGFAKFRQIDEVSDADF